MNTGRVWNFSLAAAAALVGTAAIAGAPKTSFTPMGVPFFVPTAISDDGSKVVGSGYFGPPIFYYTAAEGVVPIGGGCTSGVPSISGDGGTIVACTFDENGHEVAAKWLGGTDWQSMGSVPGAVACDAFLSSVWDVDYTGSTAVGLAWLPQQCQAHAGSWDVAAGGPAVDLGSTTPNAASRANTISGNGQIIAGWQDTEFGSRQGARWVGGVEDLVLTEDGDPVGEVAFLNFDGTVMAGSNVPYGTVNAWVWTSRHGFTAIPAPGPVWTQMVATGASEDGSIVIGIGRTQSDQKAWVFTKGRLTFLKDYLAKKNLAAGWTIPGAAAISADGKTIVGWGTNPDGAVEGYVIANFK